MNETTIAWTERSWNPMSGCRKVSAGCKFCYALQLAEQKRGTKAFPNGFDLTIRPHKLKEPLKVKAPSFIFVNSMSDLFWEDVPDSYRDRIIEIMELTPQHIYQVLTKRPEEMLRYSARRPLPDNMWAGVTVENEACMSRLDVLQKVQAKTRFVSAEPLLSPLPGLADRLDRIHWVITGGESGNHLWKQEHLDARSLVSREPGPGRAIFTPRDDRAEWVRDIRDACAKTGTAFFHKQWGGPRPGSGGDLLDGKVYHEYPGLPGDPNGADQAASAG